MKRWISLAIAAMLLFSMIACSTETNTNVESNPNWNKVVFIGGSKGTEPFAVQRLKGLGLDVTVKSDRELTAEDLKDIGLVYVSYSANPGNLGGKLFNLPVPIVFVDTSVSVKHNLIKEGGSGTFVHQNGLTTLNIADDKHPIAQGFTGKVEIFKKKSNVQYAQPAGEEAVVVATAPEHADRPLIFAYEKGAKDGKGNPVPARQVFFYLFEQSEFNVTDDGWKLFDAAVEWAIGKR